MKECTKCHRTLPEGDFYKKAGSPDGLQYVCKECQKEYQHKLNSMGGGRTASSPTPTLPGSPRASSWKSCAQGDTRGS